MRNTGCKTVGSGEDCGKLESTDPAQVAAAPQLLQTVDRDATSPLTLAILVCSALAPKHPTCPHGKDEVPRSNILGETCCRPCCIAQRDIASPAGCLPRAPHYASLGSFPRKQGCSSCFPPPELFAVGRNCGTNPFIISAKIDRFDRSQEN